MLKNGLETTGLNNEEVSLPFCRFLTTARQSISMTYQLSHGTTSWLILKLSFTQTKMLHHRRISIFPETQSPGYIKLTASFSTWMETSVLYRLQPWNIGNSLNIRLPQLRIWNTTSREFIFLKSIWNLISQPFFRLSINLMFICFFLNLIYFDLNTITFKFIHYALTVSHNFTQLALGKHINCCDFGARR